MSPARHRDPTTPKGTIWLLVAVGAMAIVCCTGPALVIAAASGALAAWLGNWWAITAAVLLTVGAVAWRLRRRRRSCRPPRRPR
ncbi:hypothetical protein [Streptomyces sp. 769]|uniref:hypothetical protein n=1 Tax=Streptomyces sp. 769 TaxID=1262452 RepID=UPI000581DD8A|nr:hypothetical protein [Streptomyces sp. 769]AJC60950.1 hypothetical protein GZL_08422 [Streptomyces sp. 769]